MLSEICLSGWFFALTLVDERYESSAQSQAVALYTWANGNGHKAQMQKGRLKP